jgi:hypothetical protein
MKYCVLYVLLILPGMSFQVKPHITTWVITKGCSLQVAGSTNVNNFSCDIINYSTPDTIFATSSNNQVLLNGNIKLDVEAFNCYNPLMTADLRKALKVKQFPKVTIFFLSMSKYPAPQETTRGSVVIVLAGVSKRFDVDYKIAAADKNYISLVGSRKVNFSDFKITPPRKLGGMIQTNNELSVVFTLKMKVLN